jgi:FtsZ-binding cell division protein ZapB
MKPLISLLGLCLLAQIACGAKPDLEKEFIALKEVVKSLSGELQSLQTDHEALKIDHEAFKIDHEALQTDHEALKIDHEALQTDHEALKIDHEALKKTVAGKDKLFNLDQLKVSVLT